MLAELGRRLLAIPPLLLVVTLLTFAVLSRPGMSTRTPYAHLPRFWNPHPDDVRVQADDAVQALVRGDSPSARDDLARLGGAALPIVLPALDGLSPEPRARVATALAPVAHRMHLANAATMGDPAYAASLWVRFWEDRSLDFRPTAIRRAVRRYAEHPSPARLADLYVLDTAVLDEILRQIGTDGPLPAPELARRLVPVALHVLGAGDELPPGTTDEELGTIVTRLRGFYFAHRIDYVALDGAGRAAATVLETQYGKWAARAVSGNLGTSRDGRPVLEILADRGRATLAIVAAGIGLGYLVALAAAIVPLALRRRDVDRGALVVLALAAALPSVVAALLAPGRWLAAVVTVSATVALLGSRLLRVRVRDALGAPPTTTALAFGAPWWRIVLRAVLRIAPAMLLTVAALELPAALTGEFVAEKALGIRGIGAIASQAVTDHDVSVLMALAVAGTLFTTVAVALGDLARALGDRRLVRDREAA